MFQSNRNAADLAALGYEPQLTAKKLDILEKNEKFCFEKSNGMNNDAPPTDEQLYHLGALHALQDTLDLLYSNDEIADMSEAEKYDICEKCMKLAQMYMQGAGE